MGNDFFITDIRYNEDLEIFTYPCKIDGYLALVCVSGTICLDINLNHYRVSENSIIFNIPGNIICVKREPDTDLKSIRFLLVCVSKEFMASIRIDFTKLFNDSMTFLEHPCITLSGNQLVICRKYLSLIYALLVDNTTNRKEAIGSLITSILYILGNLWGNKIAEARSHTPLPSARANILYDQFMKLVSEYHTSERNMDFYARKLCLTPKYLSKLVKNVSGRTAPEWIDLFVVLEAKNMLKYTDCAIKEIVYKLNFRSQSVFYKFFKAHTGLTPSEYRNR